jgi:tetratricopeptide (TPR) repeat protein
VPRLNWLFSSVACAGILTTATLPVSSQALLPYTPQINSQKLEQQGLQLLQDAVQLIKFQQYELALPRAELATQLVPNSYEVWFILGSLYLQQEQVDDGINVLQKAENLAPEEEGILFTLGNAYFRKGDYQAALEKLEAGLKIEDNAPEALFDLGNTYFKLSKLSKAIDSYEKALQQEKTFWPAINNVGLIEYEQGNVQDAIAKWQTALKIGGEQAEPKLALAVALYSQGNRTKGIELATSALEADTRYGDLQFLKDNLWGDRLLADTKTLLAIPQIQKIITSYEAESPVE